jgi:hypothetical protein
LVSNTKIFFGKQTNAFVNNVWVALDLQTHKLNIDLAIFESLNLVPFPPMINWWWGMALKAYNKLQFFIRNHSWRPRKNNPFRFWSVKKAVFTGGY